MSHHLDQNAQNCIDPNQLATSNGYIGSPLSQIRKRANFWQSTAIFRLFQRPALFRVAHPTPAPLGRARAWGACAPAVELAPILRR